MLPNRGDWPEREHMKLPFVNHASSKHFGEQFDTLPGLFVLAWLAVTVSVSAVPALVQAAEIEEVIVTAQKREQSANDVGLSITVLSGDLIRALGVNQPIDLATRTPGLNVANQFGDANTNFNIRGIGLLDFPENGNPAVSVYTDEVYVPSAGMVAFQLFDMDRVEVLKGPQGTLYGRNTTGGAVNFVSRKPKQGEELNGFVRADYGTFSTYEIEAALGGAITDQLAGRVAFLTKQRTTGYQRNRFDGSKHGEVDRTSIRGLLEWAPREDLDVSLNVHAGREDSDNQIYDAHGFLDPVTVGPCATRLQPNPNGCVDFFGTTEPEGSPYNVSVNPFFGSFIESSTAGGSVKVNWDLPRATLTSITGYDRFHRILTDDFDTTIFTQFDDMYKVQLWALSQELRLTSDDSWPVRWIVGGFYSADFIKAHYLTNSTDFGFGIFDNRWKQKTRSAAGFGHFEWPFAEKWQLIGGIRYTWEKKEFSGGDGFYPGLPFLLSFVNTPITENDVSGEAGLEFRPNDDWLIYGKWGRGFKSGGFDGSFTFGNVELVPAEPEQVSAIEGGFKATLLGGAMQLNGAAYYYEWDDFQAQLPIGGGVPNVSLGNAGDAEIIGVESDLSWTPVDGLIIGAGMNWFAKSKVVRSKNPAFVGNEIANTPDFTFNGLVRYTHPLPWMQQNINGFVQTDFNYKDDVFWQPLNTVTTASTDYWVFNVRFGVTTPDERVELAIWGRNLGDEEYHVGGFEGQDFTHDLFFAALPRTVGVSFTYRYE